jgi:hypothetical protein
LARAEVGFVNGLREQRACERSSSDVCTGGHPCELLPGDSRKGDAETDALVAHLPKITRCGPGRVVHGRGANCEKVSDTVRVRHRYESHHDSEAQPDARGLCRARALLGRLGGRAAERAGGDRRLEGRGRRHAVHYGGCRQTGLGRARRQKRACAGETSRRSSFVPGLSGFRRGGCRRRVRERVTLS